MRRTILILGACCLVVLLATGPAARAVGEGQTTPKDAATAERTLERATVFALGGVGFAGTTSDEEKALRAVLARRDASAALRALLAARRTTDVGRLYALLGLRWKDMAAYRRAVGEYQRTRRSKGTVKTMRGCVQAERPIADVVKEMEKGDYDGFKDAPTRTLPGTST